MAVVNWRKASRFLQLGFLLNICVLTVNAYTHTRGHPLFVGKRLSLGGGTEDVQSCVSDAQCPWRACCVRAIGNDVTPGVCVRPSKAGQLCVATAATRRTLSELLLGGKPHCGGCQLGYWCQPMVNGEEQQHSIGICYPSRLAALSALENLGISKTELDEETHGQ